MAVDDPVLLTCAISGAVAEPRPVPGDPVHARGVRGRGAPGGRRGRGDDPHPRAHAGRRAVATRSRTSARSPRRSPRRSTSSSTSRPARSACPVEKRVAYLRALRPEVAALNMGSMNYAKYSRSRRDFVFSMVFANPFEEIIALLEAMNELGIKPEHECFDLGHVGSLEPLVHKGVLREPLHVSCVMGVLGGVPPTARNLAAMVDNIPAGLALGPDRDRPRAVDAGRRRAGPRRLGPRRAGGQLLPARRHDGALQRRPGRAGAADGRGRGRGAWRDGRTRRARCWQCAGGMSGPLAGIRVLDLSRLLPGGFCSLLLADYGAEVLKVEDTGLGDYIRWAPPRDRRRGAERGLGAVPRAQPRQALHPARLEGERRPRGAAPAGARARRAARVVPPRRARPPGRRLRAACARRTPASCTARSPATGRRGPTATGPGHDLNYLARNGLLGLSGARRRAARPGGGPDRRPRRRRADGGVRRSSPRCTSASAPARGSSSTSR